MIQQYEPVSISLRYFSIVGFISLIGEKTKREPGVPVKKYIEIGLYRKEPTIWYRSFIQSGVDERVKASQLLSLYLRNLCNNKIHVMGVSSRLTPSSLFDRLQELLIMAAFTEVSGRYVGWGGLSPSNPTQDSSRHKHPEHVPTIPIRCPPSERGSLSNA